MLNRFFYLLFFALTCLLNSSVTLAASADDGAVVRVGYYLTDAKFQAGENPQQRKSGYAYEYLQKIAGITGWRYKYVYGTRAEILKKLAEGEIDLAAGVHKTEKREKQFLFPQEDMRLQGEPVYIVFAKGRTDLLQKFNYAQQYLDSSSPGFWVELWQKYYREDTLAFILTPEEREWLEKKKELKFGFLKYAMPISGIDEIGDPNGIVQDIIKMLSAELGIKIVGVPYDTSEEMQAGLKMEHVDMIFPTVLDPWKSDEKNFFQTEALVHERIMLLTDYEALGSKLPRISINKEWIDQSDYLERYYPNSKKGFCQNGRACLEEIEKQKSDSLIGVSNVLLYYMRTQKEEPADMHLINLEHSEELAIATVRKENPLLGILNRSIHQVLKDAISGSLVQHSNVRRPPSLMRSLRENLPIFGSLTIAIFMTLAVILSMLYKEKRRLSKSQKESEQMRIAADNAREQAEKAKEHAELAQMAAEKANQSKSSFLSSVSHDIRTPMNGILCMTAIAKTNFDNPEKVSDCLNKIEKSGLHLLDLINQILDMSKLEAGQLNLNSAPFNLGEIFNQLITINQPNANAKRQTIHASIRNIENETVIGDKTRLQQIFTNLLSNAIKYTPEGGHISLCLSQNPGVSDNIGYYTFTVTDNGIGIDEDFLKEIFTPFKRAKNVGTIQGTGLGLSVIQRIVRQMGGDISVKSELGKGSTFTATFPLLLENRKQKSLDKLKGRNILIANVDDEETKFLCRQLSSLEMNPYVVSNVDEIEGKFGEREYWAVLAHWYLVGNKADKIFGRIREKTFSAFPIIVLSPLQNHAIDEVAKKAGASRVIETPIFRSALISLFEDLLSSKEYNKESDLKNLSEQHHWKNVRILLVEDNELNAEIAKEILELSDVSVDWVNDGTLAVEKMKTAPAGYYDCILMDIRMQIMSGLEATRQIRKLDNENRFIPIIALTANVFADEVQEQMNAGMDYYLAKPIDIDEFFKVLSKVLDKRKASKRS